MMKGIAVAAALAALAFRSGSAAPVVIEAESFADLGGWTLDSQFMETMGSPYLLAHGLGIPVADAKTEFDVKSGGLYDVYARTLNWTAPWSKTPAGRFSVKVDGAALESEGGAIADYGWGWQKLGAAQLKAGRHSLSLCDSTGFDGRCDKIALVPAGERFDAASCEAAPSGHSKKVEVDFVVVGGGVAGTCAAIAAARNGMKVALVQDRPVLGGNNSSEVRVHLGGRQNLGPYPRLGDVVSEIGPAKGGNAQGASVYEDRRKTSVVKAEKNIFLFLNTKAIGVNMGTGNGGRRIESVEAVDVRSAKRYVFSAPLFLDATGDGTVGALAGADFRMGREAKGETGEASAPDQADMMTMGSSVQWYAGERGAAFAKEPWMLEFTDENATAALRGDWDWETGIGRDPIADAERIRDYGMLVVYSNWAHVKNSPKTKAKFADKSLKWVASVAGRRESRRLLGDVVLTENDIDGERYFPDGTCLTSWSVDLHFPRKASETKFDGEAYRAATVHKKVKSCPIPYRALYSRNVENLFMAGRNISVTHAALGTVRVMRTTGMMGEVVGMAAAICKRNSCRPRGVFTHHLDELKAAMAKGAGLGRKQPPQTYNEGFTLGVSEKALQRPGFDRPLKVLMIGNSFSRPVVFNLPPLAKEAGVKLDLASLYIGGCSLERHAKNIEKTAKDASDKQYEVLWSYVSSEEPPFLGALGGPAGKRGRKGSIQDLLAGDAWDVVTIQQASPLSWRPESYDPWGDKVIAEVRRLAPQAEIMVQETWSYCEKDSRIRPGGEWGFDRNEMYRRIHDAYSSFADARGFRVIPTGAAVQAERAKGGDDVVGSGGDTIHLNKAGERLQARVWLKALTGVER